MTGLAKTLNVIAVILHPARRARNYFHIMLECLEIIIVSGRRIGELNGHISRREGGRVKVMSVIHVNTTYDFMSSPQSDFLYHTPHFTIAYQCYRSEEHTSELQSRQYLVCRLLLEKKTNNTHEP